MQYIRIALAFISLLYACSGSADTYDPLLLRAQASIFPKIILLDQDLNKKTPDNKVVITIVSTIRDPQIAEQLKKLIEDKYGGSLGNKKLKVNVTTFDKFNSNTLSTVYIVLDAPGSMIEKVVSYASSHERIVFSYSYADFVYNTLISLHVKEKTYIYINKSAVQSYGIRFLPVFYALTKVIG